MNQKYNIFWVVNVKRTKKITNFGNIKTLTWRKHQYIVPLWLVVKAQDFGH